MAEIDYDPHFHAPPRRDGAPLCMLCRSTDLEGGQDWCPAAQCLVCDDCCRGLVTGDTAKLADIVMGTGRLVTPSTLFEGCSHCHRGHARFAERVLAETETDSPAC
jgi:hypothetical protein